MLTSDPSTASPSGQTGSFLVKKDRNKACQNERWRGEQKHLWCVHIRAVTFYSKLKLLFEPGKDIKIKYSTGNDLLEFKDSQCTGITSCAF